MKNIRREKPDLYNQIVELLSHPFNDFRVFQGYTQLLRIHCKDARDFLFQWETSEESTLKYFLELAVKLNRGDIVKRINQSINGSRFL